MLFHNRSRVVSLLVMAWFLGGVLLDPSARMASADAPAEANPTVQTVDDFESTPFQWNYVGGEEFPGAQGSLTRDTAVARAGTASAKLTADFSGGGAYVGCYRGSNLGSGAFRQVSFWVKPANLTGVGVRLLDSTGQTFQKSRPLAPGVGWQQITVTAAQLEGAEYWGGANDGHWHGALRGLGINIGKNRLADAPTPQASLWIDDIAERNLPAEQSTIYAATPTKLACLPDYGYTITYHWDAQPVDPGELVFVHFVDASGKLIWNNDQSLPVPPSQWAGPVTDTEHTTVGADVPPGDYRIVTGLYNPTTGGRQTLETGPGVIDMGDKSYQVGILHVGPNAPVSKLPAPTLNLKGYHLTFDDEFNDLSVSASGPRTRWFTGTKGIFGDAQFVNQQDGFPFAVKNGILTITARKDASGWKSGILASVDPQGNGFAQKFGYFEMRAKFPPGPGTWPAFWLLGQSSQQEQAQGKHATTNPEVDVVEQYGAQPRYIHATLHLWSPDQPHWGHGQTFIVPDTTDGFHTYGVMIEDQRTTFYYDSIELCRSQTPAEDKVPLYILVNLALGCGWPIDKTPNPSVMQVDYMRAYAKKGAGEL